MNNLVETLKMKTHLDIPALLLLCFSTPNFFSEIGIVIAIINQLYRMSEGVMAEGGFKPFFVKLFAPYIAKLAEWAEIMNK